MNRDDIIRMAREACGDPAWDGGVDWVWGEVERFAQLVAEHEREACAKVAEEMGNIGGNMNKTWRNGCFDVAFAIRERGAP